MDLTSKSSLDKSGYSHRRHLEEELLIRMEADFSLTPDGTRLEKFEYNKVGSIHAWILTPTIDKIR